jgi:hypothetical protein
VVRRSAAFIKRNSEGFIASIRVEATVPPEDAITQSVEVGPNGMPHFSSIGGLKTHRAVQATLQLIESILGVTYQLHRVRWEHAESVLIPENVKRRMPFRSTI